MTPVVRIHPGALTHPVTPLCYRPLITRVARVQTETRHGVRGWCSAMTRPSSLPLRIVESSEAALRLDAAREWLDAHGRRGAVIVGASRGAADDFARAVARTRGGALGLHRFSFTQLAAHLAAPVLAARGAVPVTRIGT